MWDSVDDGGGGDTDVFGSGDYGETDYDDNGTSSVQFSFTNVENNRSEENVIELPGILVDRDSDLQNFGDGHTTRRRA